MGLYQGTLVALLLFVSCALGSVERSTTCGFVTRDLFSGSYTTDSTTVVPLLFAVGFEGVVTEISPTNVYDTRWAYEENRLTVTYVSSYPRQGVCSLQGTYNLAWNNNCGTATLTAISDQCGERRARFDGLVLSEVVSPCKFQRNEWWRGIYPGENPLLSNLQVLFNLGTKTDVNETSVRGTIHVDWAMDPVSRNLLSRDVSATAPGLACVRNPDDRALYSLIWSRNCTAIEFRHIANDCPQRKQVYDKLFITRGKDYTQTCRFYPGDSFTGHYSTSENVAFSFGDDNKVSETSLLGERESRWFIDSKGDLTIRDIFAQPYNFSCGPSDGKYYVDWNKDCSHATLTLILDSCGHRRKLLNTISITKVVSQCKFYSGDTWTGIYPGRDQTRSGALATLQFGDNFMVDESFHTLSVDGSVDSRWQLTSGGSLDIRWLGANPKASCLAQSEALYSIQWSQECTVAQLHVIYDACASRQSIYDKFTITRTPSSCSLLQGETYSGVFPAGGTRAGLKVQATITNIDSISFKTSAGTFSTFFSWTDYGNVNFLGGVNDAECGILPGTYVAIWSADCNTLKLVTSDDGCDTRAGNFNGLVLTRGSARAYQCRTLPGDNWRGLYAGNDTLFSGRTVTFSFSSNINAMEVSSAGSVAVSWSINDQGILSVGEVAELSPDQAILCPAFCGKKRSLYQVTWDNDCTQLTLSLIADSCGRRAETYNGLVLKRINPACDFYPNEEWRGVYTTSAGVVANQVSRIVFSSTKNQLTEYARDISWTNCWQFNANRQLTAVTFSSSPPQQSCSAKAEGLFSPVWSENCNTVTLWAVYDPCAERGKRYEALTLSREVNNGPACAFRAGDLWEGNFSSIARVPFTGAGVKVQFTASTAIFESSSGQTKLGNWFVDRQGLLTVRDVSSKPSTIYACDASLTAQYNLKWSWDCNTVEFRTNFDPCERRRNRMEGMTLKKTLSKCRLLKGEIWDGVAVGGKYAGQNINVTVGPNSGVLLSLPKSTINARWSLDKNGFLNVVDDKSPNCQDACDSGVHATYSGIYSHDCNRLTLNVVSDPCPQRYNLYDNLVLTKRYKTVGDQLEVTTYETETEVQFNFGGMLPPLPCCNAPKDPACNSCGCK